MKSSEKLDLDQSRLDKVSDTTIEVSYAMLDVSPKNTTDVLEKFAITINVQLTLQPVQEIPFIPFNGFDKVKEASKLFLYGPSGFGKSRCIYELVKKRIANFKDILIINPRHAIGAKESGRAKLTELFARFGQEVAVIWDNFPDDIIQTDLDLAKAVLEKLSSKNMKTIFVALKPKYLEAYRDVANEIFELYVHEISFDEENLENIIKLYGANVKQFKEIYEKYVLSDTDKISKILWGKEPTPLTVLDYYKELTVKKEKEEQKQRIGKTRVSIDDSAPSNLGGGIGGTVRPSIVTLDVIGEAKKLLRPIAYYEHQFAHIIGLEERQSDVEFLYTLKLAYELGLGRTIPHIQQLQKGIFFENSNISSSSTTPTKESFGKLSNLVFRRLSSWVYISGQYCAMHDVSKDAIKFNDYVNLKITNYLTENFEKIIPNEDNAIYSFGMFLGRNIQFVQRDTGLPFVPPTIYNYMKSNRYFETGFGRGTAESFLSLDNELQKIILRRVELDLEFARGLGDGLGRKFASLDESSQQQILKRITSGLPFARFLGESLGRVFGDFSQNLRDNIFGLIEENVQFADGIGMGIGYSFLELDMDIRKRIFAKAEKNSEFTRGLAYGMGLNFLSLDKEFQKQVFARAEKNTEFAKGLGTGFGFIFKELPPPFQKELLAKAENNMQFAVGIGSGLGYVYPYLSKELQEEVFARAEMSIQFAVGLGSGLGHSYTYLNEDIQQQIFAKAAPDTGVARGLGEGLGHVFRFLTKELRNKVLIESEKTVQFAVGLGSGLGYVYPYLSKELQEEVFARAVTNLQFAKGLGGTIARSFRYLDASIRQEVLARGESNAEFAHGLGYGFGFTFKYLQDEFRQHIFARAENNMQFAVGLGSGLGYVYPYLSKELQEEVFARAIKNSHTGYGLGFGIAQVLAFLPSRVQQSIFTHLTVGGYIRFARGLGTGLGHIFPSLREKTQEEVLRWIDKNSEFAETAGIGIVDCFCYLDKDQKDRILTFAKRSQNVTKAITAGTKNKDSQEEKQK